MKKVLCYILGFLCCFIMPQRVHAKDEVKLYAKSAVILDGSSGQVLYERQGSKKLPNASTTKILTCYYVILHGNLKDKVLISANAAKQPKVSLGVRQGECYLVKDLLYALMLESDNDCAVALAEYMEKSVPAFAKKLNQLAVQMGAKNTHFVTPNGLDASDLQGCHQTTAYDLTVMMTQCIKNQEFLDITRKQTYSFHDVSGKRTFTCNNHNALLQQSKDAISGKTGYTSRAGYCYVGAVKVNHMTLVIAILASGWPPHKSYKWSDVRTLIAYATKNYVWERKLITYDSLPRKITVTNGTKGQILVNANQLKLEYVRRKTEKLKVIIRVKKQIQAPVKIGDNVGSIQVVIGNKVIAHEGIQATNYSLLKNYWWYLGKIIIEFLFPIGKI